MSKWHLKTGSGPNVVAIMMHDDEGEDGEAAWIEGSPEVALDAAWCIIDSTCHALEKGGREVPSEVLQVLALLRKFRDSKDEN